MVDNRGKLMWASFLTLIAAGMGFGVRAGTLVNWANDFGFTQTELGEITGFGLIGFGVVILFVGFITDRIGYKTILLTAFVLHVLSVVITLAAQPVYDAMGKDATYYCLTIGVSIFAVANGLCEAVINPLIANIYPERKTHYLNILHAGWPGGLILGGIVGLLFLGKNAMIQELRWEIVLGLYLLPVIWYGLIVLKEPFPESDVKKAGVSVGESLAQFASPVLLFLIVLHACVGYVELGTDSWITNITEMLTEQGFLLFIYASLIMFVLRFVAGPIVERINPLGLLCVSTILGTVGLYMLGGAQSAGIAWVAVTIYGFGKTFLWPTMLGIVGERFPKGGALAMGVLGGVGMLSAGVLGAKGIGYKQDRFASEELARASEAENTDTFERYRSDDMKSFLFFKAVPGIDGRKKQILLDKEGPATGFLRDYEIMESESKVTDEATALKTWWEEEAEEHATEDKPLVSKANIEGGRMALKITAAVPAAMFVGYLILVVYFSMTGGYKVLEIESEKKGH